MMVDTLLAVFAKVNMLMYMHILTMIMNMRVFLIPTKVALRGLRYWLTIVETATT